MSLIENISNNIKVLHKVKSVPTNTSKLGIHLVEGGGVYIVAKDPITPTLKVVKKIYDSSDYYMKGSVDTMLSAQKQLLDDADAILQSQVTAVQQTTATHTAEIQNIKDEYVANKGYYNSLVTLQAAYPTPDAGDIAYVANVASTTGYYIYNVVGGVWTASAVEAPPVSVPIANYAEHGYTGTPKTLKTVEDEKASEIAQLAGDIFQVYVPSKYESIIADEDGWVMNYAYNPYYLIMDFNAYGNDTFMVDSIGWVGEKTGYIREQPIPKDVFVKDQFSDAIVVKSEAGFLGFPGICADNNGVLHSFWREGSGHVSDDGSIIYSRSIDNGDTWIDEMVALPGHELVNGYYSDWRDSRAIFTKDGKVLYLSFKSWTNDGGVTYDANRTQLIATIFPLLNGKIDIVNKTEVVISNQIPGKGQASSGALFYHKNELYVVAYGDALAPNDNNLIKSADNGITWTFVGRIGTYNNECAVGVIGDRMVAVTRNVEGALSDYYVSDDFGVTWTLEKSFNSFWHGMDAKGLSDCVLVAGRHGVVGTTTFGYSFVIYDKFGNEVFPKFDIHNFGGNGDCAYGQICSFQRWVYFIYYNSLLSNSTIYFKRILRSEILGLNY